MKKLSKILFFASILALATNAVAQTAYDDGEEIKRFFKNAPVDYSLGLKNTTGSAKSATSKGQRPDHLNNQELKFFAPIFNQSGGSCSAASGIAYDFNYELNSFYNHSAKESTDYRLPTHFNWLMTFYGGALSELSVARDNGIPSVTDYGGQTYSRYFGQQDYVDKGVGWMQGYDKWYRAMFNRARGIGRFPSSILTPEGVEQCKQWLWNHSGDNDFQAGGVIMIGLASGGKWGKIPSTATNKEIGVDNKFYVATWGPKYDHALTIVGYDDRIEFDLDSNGIAGEKDKGEVGAWIIANSWGDSWCNNGTIYCPYVYSCQLGTGGAAWDATVYHIRKNYRPYRTIKLLMDYSRRYELALCGGVSQDTTAKHPEFTTPFNYFTYPGSNREGTFDVPMLGRWADGYHYEPMEFGYDLTELTENVDRTKPVKYFFYINTKYAAKGKGNIYKATIMDYEFNRNGVEIPFRIDTVAILNKGKTTMISVIVPGEQTYKPLNLQLNGNTLTWQAPQKSNLKLKGYAVYCGDRQIAQTSASECSYEIVDNTIGVAYNVVAIYDYQGQDNESAKSNTVYSVPPLTEHANTVLELKKSFTTIPNAIPSRLNNATIEFWIKPYSLTNWNQQLGVGWGTFLFHANSNGKISVGWNTGSDRIDSSAGMLKLNTWSHIAVTIAGNVMTLYVNGVKAGSIKSNNYSGIAAITSFKVGESGDEFDGMIDEFRIWNTCRTNTEIVQNMRKPITKPAVLDHLMTYINMDKVEQDGTTIVPDYVGGKNIDLTNVQEWAVVEDASILTGGSANLVASFELSADSIYVGEHVATTSNVSISTDKIEWSAPGSKTETSTMSAPEFAYEKAGKYTITLKAYDAEGSFVEASKDIVVISPVAPVANFEVATDGLPAGDAISLINRSVGNNCTYKWSMPGATVETTNSTNTTASYIETGSHPITLTVTNEAGISSITKYVNVKNTTPAVDFNVNPSAIVFGDKVALTDQTKYAPTKWMWSITNSRHNIGINGQNYVYTPKAPGIYNVTLTATNEVGTGSKTISHAFMVSNADPQNGLSFGGGKVAFASPVSSSTKNFSIDYWLYPYNVAGAANLSTDDGIFKVSTDADGMTTVYLNGKSVASTTGYVVANEWHHYAITYKGGTVMFYRDGEKFCQATGRLALKSPAWTGNVTIGDDNTPFLGIMDEFKFWNKSLSVDELQETCNAPIANIDSMKTKGGLVVYYDFNQTSGNVNCLTDEKYTGVRTGFGPDGDAWGSSLGVFTLDFTDKVAEKDVTADYLTNYKAPFLHTSTSVNSTNYVSRFVELETGTKTSTWQVENTITNPTNNVTTGTYVDTYFNGDLSCTTTEEGFATSISDQRTYQTVTLPMGRYRLAITPNAEHFASTSSYLVANEGDTLVGNNGLDKAIAYTYLDDKELTFDILEDGTTVSLGFIFNVDKKNSVAVEAITLIQYPYEFIDAEDPNAVEGIQDNDIATEFTIENGGVRCTTPGYVRVTNLQGVDIFSASVERGMFIKLYAGIYVINGKKIEVK